MANQSVTRTVNLIINGKQAKASIEEVNRAVSATTRSFGKLREADNPKLYQERLAALQKLKQTQREMRMEINGTVSAQTNFLNGFKTIAAGVIGGNLITGFFAGLSGFVNSSIDSVTKRADQLSDVQKTTGLTLEAVKALNDELGKIDTRTSRGDLLAIAEVGGRFGIAENELLGFVRAADKAGVALGDSFSGGAEEVATQLSRLQSLFEETKGLEVEDSFNKIGSAMNELGANFKANEQYMANFTTRVGNLPGKLKPSITDAFALATAFQESGIEAEVASRAYSIFLNKAIERLPEFADFMGMSVKEAENLINTDPTKFFVKFSEATKGMKATDLGGLLQKLGVNADGANKIIGSMSNNTERFAEIQKVSNQAFEEGISLTNEFNIKNENAAAQYEKALKKINGALKDVREAVANVAIGFITWLSENIGGLLNLAKVIVVGATAWMTYRAAVLLSDKANITFITNLLRTERMLKLQKAATLAAAAAKALFTGNIKKAAQAMRLFNVVTKLNPIGLIVGGITAAVVAFSLFNKSIDAAARNQKEFSDISLEAGKSIVSEKLEIERLIETARDENKTKAERLDAIKKINAINPKYLGDITIEKINQDSTNKSIEKYLGLLKLKAMAKAAEEKLIESSKQQLEAESKSLEDNAKWYDNISGGLLSGAGARKKSAIKEATEDVDFFTKKLKELNDAMGDDANPIVTSSDDDGTYRNTEPNNAKSATNTKADKAAKELEDIKKARDKELEEIQKGFDAINKQRQEFEDDQDKAKLDATEKEIADLDAKYEEQLNKLLEYSQRSIALEGLTNEERAALASTANLIEQQLEAAHQAELDRIKLERDTANGVNKAANAEILRVALLSEQEQEIERINAHYDTLQKLAIGNAEAMALIEGKRAADIGQLNMAANAKEISDARALSKAKQDVALQAADVLMQIANATARQGEELSNFQKAAAITSILVNQAVALGNALATTSAPTPDNVATGGLAGIAKFLTVSASILSTVSQVRNVLGSANVPTAPQFYGGGLTDVYGQQDGRRYSARNVGSFSRGGRVGSPSVGLIGERGPELVIPNRIYTNPANANVMAALESSIARQYYNGGATNNVSNVVTNGIDTELMQAVVATLNRLNNKLSEPIVASTYLSLQELEDAQKRRSMSQNLARIG